MASELYRTVTGRSTYRGFRTTFSRVLVKRHGSRRILALLGAVFLLLNTAGEAFGVNPCPYHDGLASEVAREAGHGDHGAHDTARPDRERPSNASHHAHGGHEYAEPDANAGDSGGAHHRHEVCTHVEICQTSAGAIAPLGFEASELDGFSVKVERVVRPVEPLVIAFLPYVLPYAHAPPIHG